jgi:O-6-methylguanine DNA methyltransferase
LGICRIGIKEKKTTFLEQLPRDITWVEKTRDTSKTIEELTRNAISDIRIGTPFQHKVWAKIAKIPHGETRSYAQIAKAIGRPKAHRAVANACGANPVPLIIPCHRVIASDGTIGGFSCGITIKKKLLAMERLTG